MIDNSKIFKIENGFKYDLVKDYILGLYSKDVDAGHGKWHINNVCDNFDIFIKYFPEIHVTNIDLLKLGLALHDIGLSKSVLKQYLNITYKSYDEIRKNHHINSAKIFSIMLEVDNKLSSYSEEFKFYKDDIKHAIEHHRASVNQITPLDKLYRCCDGFNNYQTTIVRSCLYNLNHSPNLSYEQICINVQKHIIEKYLSKNAYCDTLPNVEVNKYFLKNLKKLRKVFYDKTFVKKCLYLIKNYYNPNEKDENVNITNMLIGVNKIWNNID